MRSSLAFEICTHTCICSADLQISVHIRHEEVDRFAELPPAIRRRVCRKFLYSLVFTLLDLESISVSGSSRTA